MIELAVPLPLLWMLRWLLFLGPLGAALALGWRARHEQRALVGGLFAFLYGLGSIFVTHTLAGAVGWWSYGGNAVMIAGLPADIWIGGALLFGPVLYFAFPKVPPLLLLLSIMLGLHGTVFLSLQPFVTPGPFWYVGVPIVFATSHLPALYLARWTAEDRRLGLRAALLAAGYGCLAFVVLPATIMHAMGSPWTLAERPMPLVIGGALLAGGCCVLGLSAVQMFVLYGRGTPIPLDPTQRLVRSGVFAYIRNPMQLCTALVWIIEGVVLGNVWVAAAALMAWVFVAGMVRWHHRYDLLVRFPRDWTEYATSVPEWLPRWRPWLEPGGGNAAFLRYDPERVWQVAAVAVLKRAAPVGIEVTASQDGRLVYSDERDGPSFSGVTALAAAFQHTNLALMLAGAAVLLVIMPLVALLAPLAAQLRRRGCPGSADHAR
jgi:protein-S-isoprenylcysteine O-methyltransferase Ste14